MSSDITIGKTQQSAPYVKFRRVGEYIDVALCKVDELPLTALGSEIQIVENGKPRWQDVVTVLVIRGDACAVAAGEDVTLNAGDVVSIWISRNRRWEFIAAQRKLGRRLKVGDVMRVTYVGDKAGQFATPMKEWSFQIREAKPEESAQTDRCVAIYKGDAESISIGSTRHDDEPF
jgi:hypothetical protein